MWHMSVFPSGPWGDAACGGPRSCDGSCSGIALSELQSWFGAFQGRPYLTGFGKQVSGPPIGYLKPGPVWHASAAKVGKHLPSKQLRILALNALKGVGDPDRGEWEEWTGVAYHIRRRLTEAEEATTGPAKDIRGTMEAFNRANAAMINNPKIPIDLVADELNQGKEQG